MKKLAILAAGVAMTLAVAAPAFARESHHQQSSLTVSNTDTHLTNNVATVANTGLNMTTSSNSRSHEHRSTSGDITTGGNVSASAGVQNSVNYTQVGSVSGDTKVTNRDTRVTNNVLTVANSGLNMTGSGDIHTGSGVGAGSVIVNDVNSTVIGL